jgi:hypothetical protein
VVLGQGEESLKRLLNSGLIEQPPVQIAARDKDVSHCYRDSYVRTIGWIFEFVAFALQGVFEPGRRLKANHKKSTLHFPKAFSGRHEKTPFVTFGMVQCTKPSAFRGLFFFFII